LEKRSRFKASAPWSERLIHINEKKLLNLRR
jgi:hypothetical protein